MGLMDNKTRITEAAEAQGFTVSEFYEHPDNGLTGKVGQFEVVNDEYEDDGLYLGDLGELEASVVGAAQYRNERVSFTFIAEGNDAGSEVRDFSCLDPVTD